jgi:pimeloyl-ACP methyl ester carboxylesterase
MPELTSRDGTRIAFDTRGSGTPVILVLGAFNERSAGASLADWLTEHVTTVNYDRRGRGISSDGAAYSPEREVDDLTALIDEVGGEAAVFGYSSGAVLAMLAAASGARITRLALYEPPTPNPDRSPEGWIELASQIENLVADGDRGSAVELFQTQVIGMPQELVAQLRTAPFRAGLERIAHTTAYDLRILASDPELPARVTAPSLVMVGGESPPVMDAAARSVASALPNGRLTTLPGVGHDLVPDVVGPVLLKFLTAS